MTTINLLPWREQRRNLKNRIFAIIAGFIAGSMVCICLIVNLAIQGIISSEEADIKLLNNEISSLEGKIAQIKGLQERQNLLLSKKDIIQALQASRPFIVKLFEDIPVTMPDGVYLLSMQRKANKFTLEGMSDSNAKISIFMRNLEQLKWLQNSILQEIKTQNSNNDADPNKKIIFKLQGDINY